MGRKSRGKQAPQQPRAEGSRGQRRRAAGSRSAPPWMIPLVVFVVAFVAVVLALFAASA